MIDTIYLEIGTAEIPRVESCLESLGRPHTVQCQRYGEVFNRRAQNFRRQKARPSLIVAQKHEGLVLPAPPGYGIGSGKNFYFSHMLNCLYDCRYCFLQGMYASANYVWFANYEDFQNEIAQTIATYPEENIYFFSGYDCDSLALGALTGFTESFVPFFETWPNAWLELRTKSVGIKPLLRMPVAAQTIIAFSLTPEPLAEVLEHGAPKVGSRIRAAGELAKAGWNIGLRFDPVLYDPSYRTLYGDLFSRVFSEIPERSLHSVSLGPMRFPKVMFDRIVKLYPDEALFSGPLSRRGTMISYARDLEEEMHDFCSKALLSYVPRDKLFTCLPESWT